MIRFTFFALFYCLSTFLYSQNSIRTDDLNYSLRGGSYDQKVDFLPGVSGKDIRDSFQKQAGYVVVDGFIIGGDPISQKVVPDDLHIVRRAQINDDENLAAIGFRHKRGGIDLLESEGSALHKYIYGKYRDGTIPFAMWGHILPLVINGRLISPLEYHRLSNSDFNSIREVRYVKWDSNEISHLNNLAFGAIMVKTK